MVPYGLKSSYLQGILSGLLIASTIYFYNIEINIGVKSTVSVHIPLIIIFYLFTRINNKDITFIAYMAFISFAFFVLQRVAAPLPFSPGRTFMGIALLIFLSSACIRIWEISYQNQHKHLIIFARWLFWIHIAIQICGAFLSIQTGTVVQAAYFSWMPRAFGFAGESSHVGMILSPLIFLSVVYPKTFTQNFGSLAHIFLLISVLLLGVSATGVGIYMVALIFRFIARRSLKPLLWGMPLIMGMIFFIPQIYDRFFDLLLVGDEGYTRADNLSVLVLVKGAEMAYAALTNHPFGVGMLNFQALLPYSLVAKLGPPLDTLNNYDGSSLLLKGIGEFGYPFLFLFIIVIIRLMRRLFFTTLPSLDQILQDSFIFAFIVAGLRGGSYFTGPAMVGIALILYGLSHYRPLAGRSLQGDRLTEVGSKSSFLKVENI